MKHICVKHFIGESIVEVHSFNSMQNALDFIHILHCEYPLTKVEITFSN